MEFMRDIIVLLIGFGAGYWYGKRRVRGEKLKVGESREVSGLSQAEVEKEKNLDKVMEMFSPGRELTNDDVEKALGVSDATATRYLDKLEKEDKIVQIGKEGRFVKYRLK